MSSLLFLIIFILVLALLMRLDFVFYIVYVCLGVYILSKWLTPRSMRHLKVERSYASHAFIGELIHIQLEIRNGSRLPILWLQAVESVSHSLRRGPTPRSAFSLGGRKSRRLYYTIQATKRGYYQVGPLKVSSGDLFGFDNAIGHIDPDYFTVYPRIIPFARLTFPSQLPFGSIESKQKLFEDPSRPIGVRDYQAGDTPRHINWKVSARQQKLLVRTLSPAISLETFILLNLNQEDYTRRGWRDSTEWAIVAAASFAAHLIDRRQAVGMAVNGIDPLLQYDETGIERANFDEESGRLESSSAGSKDTDDNIQAPSPIPRPIRPRPGRAHLMKLLEILARIESAPLLEFSKWSTQCCTGLSWGVTILVITSQGDEDCCRAIYRLVKLGYNPVLVVVEPYANFEEVKVRTQHLGFPAFHIAKESDLDIWQRDSMPSLGWVSHNMK